MPLPKLRRVGQVAHHMDQAHYRADDADGRRIAAHALEHLGGLQVATFLGEQVDLEDAADDFRLGAVHQQLQALARIGIGLRIGDALQAEQAFLARGHAPGDDPVDSPGKILARREEHPAEHAQAALEHVHRGLQQRRGQGAADHDQRRRTVEQGSGVAALEKVAADDGDERQGDPDQAEHIHQRVPSARRRRAQLVTWVAIEGSLLIPARTLTGTPRPGAGRCRRARTPRPPGWP